MVSEAKVGLNYCLSVDQLNTIIVSLRLKIADSGNVPLLPLFSQLVTKNGLMGKLQSRSFLVQKAEETKISLSVQLISFCQLILIREQPMKILFGDPLKKMEKFSLNPLSYRNTVRPTFKDP